MGRTDGAKGKWNAFCEKAKPGFRKAGEISRKTGGVLSKIGSFFYRFRKLFMAIPVIALSIYLAKYSAGVLPETVGIFIESNGQYAMTISKNLAVYGPMGVTGVCLALMLCSRRALYPWIISLFSLVLPFLMMVCTLFPA